MEAGRLKGSILIKKAFVWFSGTVGQINKTKKIKQNFILETI